MSQIERLTVTMSAELAGAVKDAVADGDYTSTSEVVRDALRDWKDKRLVHRHEMVALKRDIHKGMADLAAGRIGKFNPKRIIARGRKLSSARSA
jgi:antitoxin ParD1/3/4